MAYSELSSDQQIESLVETAKTALAAHGIGLAELENINHEYNSTFAVVDTDGHKYALRININSGRTAANIAGEVFFIESLAATKNFNLAKPIANSAGTFVTAVHHQGLAKELNCVLFSWLEGEDLGDEPTIDQVREVGKSMAQMHEATAGLKLPIESELPVFDDFLWGVDDFLLTTDSELNATEQSKIAQAKREIEKVIAELYATSDTQLIHADLHGWNLKWHDNQLAVFDFDDCGIGLAVQDLATAIYYLDTEDQVSALKDGYASVQPLPKFKDHEMKALLLQRRIHLLNYLYETQNPEHREMLPEYQAETIRRIEKFLKL